MPIKQEWIQNGINDQAVQWADDFGRKLTTAGERQPLTSSQIRKFYGELKRIQSDPERYRNDIPMLKAKLAYAVGRDVKKGKNVGDIYKTRIKDFYDEVVKGLEHIRPGVKQDFMHFVKLIEAVVAYHKFYGGE